ncbi:hypothetical protein MCGE09_00491, partial [Thaumarchaeota archaeon SCGC AB-539-E09]
MKQSTRCFLLLIIFTLTITQLPNVSSSTYTLIWEEDISSSGVPQVSPVLITGKLYYIEADEIFWYDQSGYFAADAQYYTTDNTNAWQWVNHYAVPESSFLQINGESVNWGPFSNGDTGHTYSIEYIGEGEAITFKIVDLMDETYSNNHCHLPVKIYEITTSDETDPVVSI